MQPFPRILVAGGAGFLGSHIATGFVRAGCPVTVIDGLLPNTGGREENLTPVMDEIYFINAPIEDVPNLNSLLAENDVIIDCMAWTSHLLAIKDPFYDLKLNVESHLHIIKNLNPHTRQKIIFLGSRGQYGKVHAAEVTEDTPMQPEDIQGIHKVAAESYYRLYALWNNAPVISLRLSNCYGENQPVNSSDIGLVGGFIQKLVNGESVDIYGQNRRRALIYARDLANIVIQLSQKEWENFLPLNLAGKYVLIEELVKTIIELAGSGEYTVKEMPLDIHRMDMGEAFYSDVRLRNLLGDIPLTDLRVALNDTIQYFLSTGTEGRYLIS